MTQKNQANERKSADKVAVEAEEIKAVLVEQRDFLQPVVEEAVQAILEMEMEECLQAGKHERTDDRQGYRSGYYRRRLITRVGTLVLRVPQDRSGRFSTEVFEQYQRSEKALVAALAQMYVQGVSTRKVAAVTQELCGHEFSASSISAITRRLEEQLAQFSQRPLEVEYPYVIVDARYERARGRSHSQPCDSGGAGDRLGGPAAGPGRGIRAARKPEQLEGFPFRIKEAGPDGRAPGGERRPCRAQSGD